GPPDTRPRPVRPDKEAKRSCLQHAAKTLYSQRAHTAWHDLAAHGSTRRYGRRGTAGASIVVSFMTDRLESWKEIAAYLGKGVRTVVRWEKTEGLRVHRHLQERRSSVFAYKSEIDAWWQPRRAVLNEEPAAAAAPPQRRIAWIAAPAAVLLL